LVRLCRGGASTAAKFGDIAVGTEFGDTIVDVKFGDVDMDLELDKVDLMTVGADAANAVNFGDVDAGRHVGAKFGEWAVYDV
jgi:hypothetical protein